MNDHINEQIDFDVEEFVPGVVMATSLKTLGYESTFFGVADCVAKRGSGTMTSVRASFVGWRGPHTVNECLDCHNDHRVRKKPCDKKALEERHRGQERERKAPGIPH